MPGLNRRPRSARPRIDRKKVVVMGEDFFQYLESIGRNDVTLKADLRELFYGSYKAARGKPMCSFSNLIFTMKRMRYIRVSKDGVVTRQTSFGSVSIDQYVTIRDYMENLVQNSMTSAGDGENDPLDQPRSYPFTCNLCMARIPSVAVHTSHQGGQRHRLNLARKNINSKRDDLIADKNGVAITTPFDDAGNTGNVNTQVDMGDTKVIDFTIKSNGSAGIILKSVVMLKPRPEFNLPVVQDTYLGREMNIRLSCSQTTNIGRLDSPIIFTFCLEDTQEKFWIIRFVSVIVVSDVMADLPPSKPYSKPRTFAARVRGGQIVDGIKPSYTRHNPLAGTPLPDYYIPKDLNQAVNNKHIPAITDLKKRLEQPLTIDNHREKFHDLLWVEELQMRVDIRKYDRENQILNADRNPQMLRLHVPGLAENRPSVLKGDHLFARFSNKSDDKSYKGYVHEVEQEDVVLGFHQDFKNKYVKGMKVDIEFTFSRYPLRNQHQAVETATKQGKLHAALFPDHGTINSKVFPHVPDLKELGKLLHDQKLSKNNEQLQAVHHIVSGVSTPAPYLVFGPPGTGKTVTIVEAAKQVYKLLPGSRSLLCAPSNSAADLIAVRLLKNSPIIKAHLLRFYAPSRAFAALDVDLMKEKCCNLNTDNELYIPTRDEITYKRVIITTLVNAGRLALAQFPKDFFSHVFIDEAGHATEPEALIALSGLLNLDNPAGGQVVMAGDPKQLGPVLRSPHSIDNGLALSFLERLMTKSQAYSRKQNTELGEGHYDQRILTKLLQNYRSHPYILKLPNELFYDNELEVHADELVRNSFCSWDELPKEGFPIIFHGVEGLDEREEQSPSFFNKSEVEVVVSYVKKVMEKRGGQKIKESDIGVISPYRKQVQKLRLTLKKKGYNDIKVGSVEEFQGQERLVIIISTVRSTKADHVQMDVDFKLGFLKNPKRFNVSVTRAKALLVIVGNPFLLSTDEHWNKMLQFCIENKGYRGCNPDKDEDLDQILDLLKKTHIDDVLGDGETEGMEFSRVSEQNDPAWRDDV